ncbi:MAG: nucleotidyltransferase domain-containing protein [Planctomycetes bacterium]|nr:nucleotidyltransferase domain-containing protein [Planctomycetota bacterium]
MGIPERWKRCTPVPPDINARLKSLTPIFQRFNVTLAYLFGSLADGRAADDVDLAVLTPGGAEELRFAVTQALGTDRLDLLDLAAASPCWRFEVVSSGKLIYKRDDESENRFEHAALREYKDTAYLRRRHDAVLRQRIAEWSSNARASQNA